MRSIAVILVILGTGLYAVGEQRDDTDSIQAGIDQCEPGDGFTLAAGVYCLSQPLRLHSNMRFRGEHPETTVIRFEGDSPGVMVDLSGCEQVEVSQLCLDGGNNPNATQGIYAHNARGLHLHHLIVRDFVKGDGFGPHGILFQGKNPSKENGVTDSLIDACRIENIAMDASFGAGIRFAWGSSHNRVANTTIHNTGRGGIFGDNGSTHLVIQGNTITGSHGTGLGIEVWGGCDYAVIEDNAMDHWLSIGGSSYCAVRRNAISNDEGVYKFCGIEAIGSCLVLTDNTVEGGQNIGLSVSSNLEKKFMYWSGNRISRCNQWGAQLQGEEKGTAYHYFYKCSFSEIPVAEGKVRYPFSEGHGFRFNGNARGITFDKCAFVNNARLGMLVAGPDIDRLRFVDCIFRGNQRAAIAGLDHTTLVAWENCTVEDNKNDTVPDVQPWEDPVPEIRFEVPALIKAGVPVTFEAEIPVDAPEIAGVLWDFGHGTPASEKIVEHVFDKPRPYEVTLVGWSVCGMASRYCQMLMVR